MKRLALHHPVWRACLFAAMAAAVLTGCRSGGHKDAAVRLINAVPGSKNLTVAVDGQIVWRHSDYRSNTGYHGIKAGKYQVDIEADSSGGRVAKHDDLTCEKGKAYTVVRFGKASSSLAPPGVRIFVEPLNAAIPRDKVRVQFINAGTGMGAVDVLFDNIVGFADVPAGVRSAPTLLNPGSYDVKLNRANEPRSVAGPLGLHFQPGHSYTLVAMGVRNGVGADAFSIEAFSDN